MNHIPAREAAPQPSKADILRALQPFAQSDNAEGLKLYLADAGLYLAGIAAVLFAPWLALKIIGAIVAGIKLSSFITLGHDAAHRTLVKSKTLNHVLARACLTPIMHNLTMWKWDHHETHHPLTNGAHFDSYVPYSKEEFDRLPRRKQLFERVIRAPNVVGFGIHYLFQRMLRVRIFPTKTLPARHRKAAWRDFAILVAYQCAFVTLLVMAPRFAPVSALQAVTLGLIVPMCVFATLVGASLYVMHTHRNVPWFKGELDRKGDAAVEYCATHLALPPALSHLVHHVFSHSVHHAHPGVPCYKVPQAQQRLLEMLGERAVSETMSLRRTIQTMRACKLYDFQQHQWLDFDGRPTTPRIRLGHAHQLPQSAATA